MRPIISVDELVAYFAGGGKPAANWRVGIEQEKIGVTEAGGAIPFSGERGIEAVLRALHKSGYAAKFEGDQLLAVEFQKVNVTVEPGGQLEFSGPVLRTADECRRSLQQHVALCETLGSAFGIRFLGVGFHPWARSDELSWLPKRRYAVMRDYLPTRGQSGLRMMQMTATVQANLDYDDEPSAVEKMRAAFGVTSIVTALFAASPIENGRPTGHKSVRAAIWLDTDNDRCGLLPSAFDDGFGFRDYANWALDVPMFFVVRDDHYLPAGGMTFRRFMREGWRDQVATMVDWETHLSTLFPEVRLKRYLELRGADAGPMPMAIGLAALWRGLLDDRDARLAAWQLVRQATFAERQQLRIDVGRAALAATFVGRKVQDLAVDLVEIAATGLARLPGGQADLALLDPLRERARSGRSPADDMLDDYAACSGNPAELVRRWTLQSPSQP